LLDRVYVSPQDYQSLLNQVTTQEASVMGEDALLVTLSNGIIYTARYTHTQTHRDTRPTYTERYTHI
jgi:hypothetical protein